jgi:hypothetical protein
MDKGYRYGIDKSVGHTLKSAGKFSPTVIKALVGRVPRAFLGPWENSLLGPLSGPPPKIPFHRPS